MNYYDNENNDNIRLNPQIKTLQTVFKQPFDMQNTYTTDNPQITFLKQIYRRHTDTKIYTKKIFDFIEYKNKNHHIESDDEISFVLDKKPTQFISMIYIKICGCKNFAEFISNLVNFELYSEDNLLYSYDGAELELKLIGSANINNYNESDMYPIFNVGINSCLISRNIKILFEFKKQYDNIRLYSNILEPELCEYRRFALTDHEKLEERTTYSNISLEKNKEVEFKVPEFSATKIFFKTNKDDVNLEGCIKVKKSNDDNFISNQYNNETEYPINKTESIDIPQMFYNITLPKNTHLLCGRVSKISDVQPSGAISLTNATLILKADKDCDVRITIFFYDIMISRNILGTNNNNKDINKNKNIYEPFLNKHDDITPLTDSSYIEYWMINGDKIKVYENINKSKNVDTRLDEICRLLALPMYEPDGTGTVQKRISIQYILDKLTQAYHCVNKNNLHDNSDIKQILDELHDLINQKKTEEKIVSDILTIITKQPDVIKNNYVNNILINKFKQFWNYLDNKPSYIYLNNISKCIIVTFIAGVYVAGLHFLNNS